MNLLGGLLGNVKADINVKVTFDTGSLIALALVIVIAIWTAFLGIKIIS